MTLTEMQHSPLPTINSFNVKMRDPLRYRFDSWTKTTHNARRIRRGMEGLVYFLSLSLRYNPLVRQLQSELEAFPLEMVAF